MYLIGLVISFPTTAASHCPDGGSCFTEERARERIAEECAEAQRKWSSCQSELADCNNIESELNKCRGRLDESRQDSRQKAQTIRHLDQTRGYSGWTVAQWTIGGVVVGVGIGGLAAVAVSR